MATWLWLVLCLACHMLACASLTSTSPLSKSALCPRSCCECSLPRSLCTSRSWQQVVRPCFRSILILFFPLLLINHNNLIFSPFSKDNPGLGGDRAGRSSATSAPPVTSTPSSGSGASTPAEAGGGASGTASGVLNEFRAQLQNLQGNQS